MHTEREREYYRMGFIDGQRETVRRGPRLESEISRQAQQDLRAITKPKRKLSAWNKFVKANSRKKIYRYANGKLKLKKMGIAFRKKKRR